MLQGEDGQTAVLTWKICKSLRKEVPPDVFCTVSNLFGTAMKLDKYGKSRFEFLCAKIPDPGCENHLQCEYVPVKIRAIQGHSKEALEKVGGLYANAVQICCASNISLERKAAFAGMPIVP